MYDLHAADCSAPPERAEFIDFSPQTQDFKEALLTGLRRPAKAIPYWYLYDEAGSALFDRITELPEYYPTRTETRILKDNAAAIAAILGPDATLYEPGAGSALKVRVLLEALDAPAAYVPIDISGEHLRAAADALQADYPHLHVIAVSADHTRPLDLPIPAGTGRRVGFYPGSSIGNLQPEEAEAFLETWRERLGDGSALVVGVDLQKDVATLQHAYDDAQGVTAAFTLNLLTRANREAGAAFQLDQFAHEARWDAQRACIEINLVSLEDQAVRVAGERILFGRQERIHVEDSYKYTRESFDALASRAGWRTREVWTDPDRLFGVWLLETA